MKARGIELKQNAPPCEKYNCVFYKACKKMTLACEAFQYYVSTGNTVHPGTIWVSHDKRWSMKKARIKKRVIPRRKISLRIFDWGNTCNEDLDVGECEYRVGNSITAEKANQ